MIEARLSEALTLEVLAEAAGLSTFHFAKMFKASFGLAPHRYVTERRIVRAKDLLAKHLLAETPRGSAGRASRRSRCPALRLAEPLHPPLRPGDGAHARGVAERRVRRR